MEEIVSSTNIKRLSLTERKIFNPDVELNKLGAEGWKLVTNNVIGAGVGGNDEVF